MRRTAIAILVGTGLLAALAVPALSCPYHNTTASADQPQQTAQTEPDRPVSSQ